MREVAADEIFGNPVSGESVDELLSRLAQDDGTELWIAEADDLAEPRFLAHLLPLLTADPNISFAFCDSRTIASSSTSATGCTRRSAPGCGRR